MMLCCSASPKDFKAALSWSPAVRQLRSALIPWLKRSRVSVHSSRVIDKLSAEPINVTVILSLIIQHNVFRHAPRIVVTMAIEVGTLIGPVSIIKHESVHCDHH